MISPTAGGVVAAGAAATAEVASPIKTQKTRTAAKHAEPAVLFFMFIISVILSSIAFLLKLLHRDVVLFFRSSMQMRVRA